MILKDKVVIITGAGPGMGQAMCRGAAAEGAKVVVSARSVDAINALAAEIQAAGGATPDVFDSAQRLTQCIIAINDRGLVSVPGDDNFLINEVRDCC